MSEFDFWIKFKRPTKQTTEVTSQKCGGRVVSASGSETSVSSSTPAIAIIYDAYTSVIKKKNKKKKMKSVGFLTLNQRVVQ